MSFTRLSGDLGMQRQPVLRCAVGGRVENQATCMPSSLETARLCVERLEVQLDVRFGAPRRCGGRRCTELARSAAQATLNDCQARCTAGRAVDQALFASASGQSRGKR
jgi:hypothetical protein